MHRLRDARIVSTIAIAIVAALAFTTVLDTAVDLGMDPMSRRCDAYLTGWIDQALATAGTAGVINAGLSVIEDSELQLEPGGLGASVALGDLVRPVNDMASRVLYVALAAAVSLKIQQKLIEIGVLIGLKWFLALSMLFLGLAVWFDVSLFRRLAWGLFVLALVGRLLIPGAVFLTGAIGDQVAGTAYKKEQAEFKRLQSETTKAKDQVVNAVPTAKEVWGTVTSLGRNQSATATPDGLKKQLLRLVESLADTRDAVGRLAMTLIAVFILQTILMPVLILWALVKLPGYLLGPSGIEGVGGRFLDLLRGGKKPISMSRRVPEVVPESHP